MSTHDPAYFRYRAQRTHKTTRATFYGVFDVSLGVFVDGTDTTDRTEAVSRAAELNAALGSPGEWERIEFAAREGSDA